MKIGDRVLISPDLTRMEGWITGTVIEVEDNPLSVLSFPPKRKTRTSSSERKICLNPKREEVCLP